MKDLITWCTDCNDEGLPGGCSWCNKDSDKPDSPKL